ncbi:CPBP family intramembrane glutamic endopeptidase [Novipirellula artificiosorum]|uniref:CAAX amino terminal protease self-immunity n=1 Tax=Novipirellula artificiosorum TaxID=2528016 RepID=A0A5C6DYU5_9BACT|nr:CPBP family intramembrane glutamic endopeptidase [Novipirellula artificiosorum]TWU41818.1 CAAX amino terminal protease self- immunity [Novipirellula artificiosorum]
METQFAAMLGAGVIAGFLAAMVLWTNAIRRCVGSQHPWAETLLPAVPRERPYWSPFDFLMAFGLSLVFTVLMQRVFASLGWISPFQAGESLPLKTLVSSLTAQAIGGIVAILATFGWLRLIRPDAARQLGLRFESGDVALGLRASLMLIPPVLLISTAVAYLVPYHHPVLESLEKSPSLGVFAILFVGTAIVAPLVEEFLFRVLLQGSLQSLADRGEANPYLDAAPDCWKPRSYWPIFVTSAFFALMHLGQGAAPVPLFFLSLGLGFLYRQSGRISLPLIVHVVLNGFTLCVQFVRFWVERL